MYTHIYIFIYIYIYTYAHLYEGPALRAEPRGVYTYSIIKYEKLSIVVV